MDLTHKKGKRSVFLLMKGAMVKAEKGVLAGISFL